MPVILMLPTLDKIQRSVFYIISCVVCVDTYVYEDIHMYMYTVIDVYILPHNMSVLAFYGLSFITCISLLVVFPGFLNVAAWFFILF